jgi:hypothetical protein
MDFPRAWFGTDIGEYRPCAGTYEYYAFASLPPLDGVELSGRFEWLGAPGGPFERDRAQVESLNTALSPLGLALPADFVVFRTDASFRHALDDVSVTAGFSDIVGPVASPVEPGAALVRIFSDQQYCASWYLYLRPSGEQFVVFDVIDASVDEDDEETIFLNQRFSRCADSFEEFAYRYWLENRLWHQLHARNPEPLTGALAAYAAHYAKP